MKYFVTGGAGFIGSALTNHLLKNGNKVTVFDNLSNTSENHVNILSKKGAKIVKGDKEIIIHCRNTSDIEHTIDDLYRTAIEKLFENFKQN